MISHQGRCKCFNLGRDGLHGFAGGTVDNSDFMLLNKSGDRLQLLGLFLTSAHMKAQVFARKAGHEFAGILHSESVDDVGLHIGCGRRGEGDAGWHSQLFSHLPQT